jgi:trimeric autotransporter adhesin
MAIRKIVSRSIGVDVIVAEDLADNSITAAEITNGAVTSAKLASDISITNLAYTGTLTGGTGVVNLGTGQVYKTSGGLLGIGTASPTNTLQVVGGISATSSAPAFQASAAIMDVSAGVARFNATGADNSTNGIMTFNTASANAGIFNERMRISSAGNVGIGTNSPNAQLTVFRVGDGTYASNLAQTESKAGFIINPESNGSSVKLNFAKTVGGDGVILQSTNGSATGAYNVVINPFGGNLIIGPSSSSGSVLEANAADEVVSFNRTAATDGVILRLRKAGGTIGYFSTNTYSLPSDERVKKNIVDIGYGLNFVNSLRPVEYNTIFQDPANETKKNFGLIAQEVEEALDAIGKSTDNVTFLEKIIPENDSDSRYGLGYQNLVPVLIKAIQELKAENDTLKQRLDAAGL